MKSIYYSAAIAAVLGLSAFTFLHNMEMKISDGYAIKFSSKDPTGVFTRMQGTINFHEEHLDASKFNVTIDVNSINTGNGMQNKHAVSEKWFDAKKYPHIAYVSDRISKTPNGFEAEGKLTIRGITKSLKIPFTFSRNGTGGTFSAKFDVNRNDFNIGDPEMKKVPPIMNMEVTVPVTQ